MLTMTELELQSMDWIQQVFKNPLFDIFWVKISQIGDHGLVWILLSICLLCFKKTRTLGILTSLSLLFSLLITNIVLKDLIARPRPFSIQPVTLLIAPPMDYSFPSGHTSASFAVAFVIFYGQKINSEIKLRWGFLRLDLSVITLATLMAISRIYLYVHFPSDVLAGVFIGFLCSTLAIITLKYMSNLNTKITHKTK